VYLIMDLAKSIRLAVDSGKVVLGSGRSVKVALNGGAKLIVVSQNCPREIASDIKHYCKLSSIPLIDFKGSSLDLGTVCGKPFPVSILSVVEEGDSDVLNALQG